MGCDVYIYKLDKERLLSKVEELKTEVKFLKNTAKPKVGEISHESEITSFEEFINYRNKKYSRTTSWSKIDKDKILQKINNNIDSLERDEIWEIISWLDFVISDRHQKNVKEIEAINSYESFGFYELEYFSDSSLSFLSPFDNFVSGYYNNFINSEGHRKKSQRNLTIEEFSILLNYMEYRYAYILYHEDSDFKNSTEMLDIINYHAKNKKLKLIAEEDCKKFISTKFIDSDGETYFESGTRKIHTDEIHFRLQTCQELRKVDFKENENILVLDLQ